ncbi:type IV secretion system protein VirB7 [Pseudomonadota bacterium]
MKKILFIILAFVMVQACSTGKTIDIKSPCVSGEDGPCGPRKSINDHWLG